jgi:general secretion pathway protein F/type IV pilus assembly protein PilC
LPLFEYKAVETSGRRVAGVLAGASEQAVLAELEARRLTPLELAEKSGERRLPGLGGRVPIRALGESYQQLADMLGAGVPLMRALKLLGSMKSRPKLAALYRQLAEEVGKGGDLAEAMEKTPRVFAPVHVAMVRAGEKGGFLEQVLTRMATLVVRQAQLRSKLVDAMIYPSILALVGVIVSLVIFIGFVPRFRVMFSKIEGGLPTLTNVVFGVSDALTKYWMLTLVCGAGLVVGWLLALRRPEVREWWERRKVRLPVIGALLRGYATARFCQLLGSMLANNVPMLAALGIAKDGTGNLLMSRAVEDATEAVRSGKSLAEPLLASGLIEEDVIEMIRVGEAANNLDEVLIKIGETVETRLDRMLAVAVKLIEPLMLVIIAGVIGVVAAGLILPMTMMNRAMGS